MAKIVSTLLEDISYVQYRYFNIYSAFSTELVSTELVSTELVSTELVSIKSGITYTTPVFINLTTRCCTSSTQSSYDDLIIKFIEVVFQFPINLFTKTMF